MRNRALDIARGFGIIAVVLGHNWVTLHDPGKLFNILFSFHLPLFFVISGVLSKPMDRFWHVLVHRGASLWVPYLSTLMLVAIPLALSGKLTSQYFAGVAYASGGAIPWLWAPLWFLPHLWLVGVVGFVVQRYGLTRGGGALARGALLAGILIGGYFFLGFVKQTSATFYGAPVSEIGLPLGVDLIGITAFYYVLGSAFRLNIESMKFSVWKTVLAMCVFFAIHFYSDSTIDLNRRRIDDLLVCTILSLCGIYIILSISEVVTKFQVASRVLSYIGRGSLFILIFHFAFQNTSHHIFYYHGKMGHGLASLLSFLVGVGIPLLALEVARRVRVLRALWMPNIAEVRQNSRPGPA